MRSTLRSVALVVAAWLVIACTPADPVIGKWVDVDDKAESREFFPDGSVRIEEPHAWRKRMISRDGTWQRIEEGRLRIEEAAGEAAVAQIYEVAIVGDLLTFTDDDGDEHKYIRAEAVASKSEKKPATGGAAQQGESERQQ